MVLTKYVIVMGNEVLVWDACLFLIRHGRLCRS